LHENLNSGGAGIRKSYNNKDAEMSSRGVKPPAPQRLEFSAPSLTEVVSKLAFLFHAKVAKEKRKSRKGLIYNILFCELRVITLRSLREI